MENFYDDGLKPDLNGVLDVRDKHWVTLDEIVWEYGESLLVLNASQNQLVDLPSGVGNLVLLRELLLAQNRIGSIPKEIGNCIQLRQLDLRRNRLSEIPTELQFCERLEILDVSYNELTSLPPGLGRLPCLRILNVRHNKLTSLPHTLSDCPKLEEVGCEGNALKDVPESLRGNTKLVLWICATVKQHRAEVEKLVEINTELEKAARMGDEERLHLRQDIARLTREKTALEQERPHNYLFVKNQVIRVSSQVCVLM